MWQKAGSFYRTGKEQEKEKKICDGLRPQSQLKLECKGQELG